MGGGPCQVDTIRTTCLITFPYETRIEATPIDAVFLKAVGIKLLKRIGREKLVGRPFGAIHKRPNGEYVSVCKDIDLKNEIIHGLNQLEHVLYIHLIFVDNVNGFIEVRESHPSFSPEPVVPPADLRQSQFIFPTLTIPNSLMASTVSIYEGEDGSSSYNIPNPENHIEDKVPLATVVQSSTENEDTSGNTEDFILLQNPNIGEHSHATIQNNRNSQSTQRNHGDFFIASSWHLQAEDMSASFSASNSFISNSLSYSNSQQNENDFTSTQLSSSINEGNSSDSFIVVSSNSSDETIPSVNHRSNQGSLSSNFHHLV